jgi:sugar phosphate isomerase/epimerase
MSGNRPLALSTMWMQHRHKTVQDFMEAGRSLGFRAFEFSYVVTPSVLNGLSGNTHGVTSLHYPAPAILHPALGKAADTLLTSLDDEAREWAVARGRLTLDTAQALGAQAVVLHLGAVEMDGSLEWVLRQRYLAGQSGTAIYEQARTHLWQERENAKKRYLDAARRSLGELASYAAHAGIRLGIETRYSICEIPSLEELGQLLSEFADPVVGYWHDAGHAQTLANLGFWSPLDWLDMAGERIVGTHLHDCLGLRDHLIPGMGMVDFALLAGRLPKDCLRVCELDWYFTEEEIKTGVEVLHRYGL